MGSMLPVVEDVDDPDEVSQSISIDIPPTPPKVDSEELAGKMAALLSAHANETRALEARIATLEALQLADTMAAAAQSASAAAASAAQSAADAARLVHAAESAIQSAAEVMASTRAVMQALSSDGTIPELLHEHCVTAATSARDTVLSCLDEARDDVAELVRDVAAVKPVVEQAATHARKPGKKK